MQMRGYTEDKVSFATRCGFDGNEPVLGVEER